MSFIIIICEKFYALDDRDSNHF